MLDIANEVDHTNESILAKLPSCALTEADEAIIETIMSKCVANTTEIFNKGLHVDEAIKRLDGTIDRSLHAINVAETTEPKRFIVALNDLKRLGLFTRISSQRF